MVYRITADSFTKISERTGTIQNVDSVYTVEMSNNQAFDSGILLAPHQKHTFSGTEIYLRCVEEGATAEVRVVPFIVDAIGGSSSVTIQGGDVEIATDEEVNDVIDNYFN